MRWGLTLVLVLFAFESAVAQSFAPPQPMALTRTVIGTRPPILAPPLGTELRRPNLFTTMPAPTPDQIYSGRFPLPGGNVFVPPTAGMGQYQLEAFTNETGGQTAVIYNNQTGSAVIYDLSTSFDYGRAQRFPGQVGQQTAATTQPGFGTQTGLAANPSLDISPLTGTLRPSGGIPMINPASPSYNFRANAPMNFGVTPSTPSVPASPSVPGGSFNPSAIGGP